MDRNGLRRAGVYSDRFRLGKPVPEEAAGSRINRCRPSAVDILGASPSCLRASESLSQSLCGIDPSEEPIAMPMPKDTSYEAISKQLGPPLLHNWNREELGHQLFSVFLKIESAGALHDIGNSLHLGGIEMVS